MVYLRAVTPALCEAMDASIAASPQNTTNSAVTADIRDFIEQRLRSLVHTQTPSQLDNALWVYLMAQEQLLLRQEAGDVNKDRTRTALPPSLQLPDAVGGVQEAVMWYCGELTTTEDASNGAAAAAAATARNDSSSSTSARPFTFRRNAPLRQRDDAHNAGARLDELLRHRHQPTAAATTTTTTTSTLKPDSAAAGAETRGPLQPSTTKTGPLATLHLALEALAHPKRAAALRQPRSLALVVRSLVSLWSVVYLCKQLRLHQLRKEQVLKGGELAGTATSAAAASSTIAVCFNDFDLLLPWDLVAAVYPGETMAAVAARCREAVRQHKNACVFPNNGKSNDAAPVSLVINPAVTVLDDNPDRLRKNARVDAIDEAANKYYYTLLATRAHGQAEAALRNASGGAAPSTSGAAAAASAAAHQEAVRSSLATVDLGDYGVLDPSRMRAPVPLSSTSGGSGGGLRGSNSSGASAERNAKSYALFLRDASIGFDIQIMALTGAGVGYYIGYLRSLSTEWCTLYAVVGLATMMLVDAVLIMIRMGRQDAAALRSRKRIRRQREKLEREGERLVQAMRQAAASAEGPTDEVGPSTEGGVAADVDAFTKKRQ